MERTITGTVESVAGRQVNTPYGESTVFDVVIGGTKYNTFKSPIAEEANLLKGSTAEATVDTSPNKNGYPKNTLLTVKLAGSTVVEETPHPAAANQQTSTIARAIPVATATNGGMPPEREAKIVRQSSMATAFNYAASAGLSEDEAFALAGRIFHKAMGTQSEGELVPVAAAPTETTEDIPW